MTPGGADGRRALRSSRPRFVIMIWGLVPGGTLSVLRDWVPRLSGHGDVSIVTLGPNRVSLGVPTVTLGGRRSHPLRFPNAFAYVARMAVAALRGSRRGRTIVLIPQDAFATGAAAVIAGAINGARVAVMEHGSASAVETEGFWRERAGSGSISRLRDRLTRGTLGLLHRLVLWRMDLAVLAGDDAVTTFRARGIGDDRTVRVRFGIDLGLFHPPSVAERADARRRWGLEDADAAVVCVGRLAPEKGIGDLIGAFLGLPEALGARLLIAGDGPLRPDLEQRATESGGRLSLVGGLEREEIASLLHSADCFVYPALRGANTPFAVLEAMASGLPVVATTAPPIHRDMLADGRGVATEPGDTGAMRAGMARYLGDRAAAAAAGAAARAYVETHHAPSHVDDAVATFVERILPER